MGLMSLRGPFAELAGTVLDKTDLKSIFCLVVFSIVISVLGEHPSFLLSIPFA